MPANVELKARLYYKDRAIAVAKKMSGDEGSLLEQEDIFFSTARGRLKLRVEGQGKAMLIHYERPDTAGPKLSDYTIATTETPNELQAILSQTLGVLGKVRKQRLLFLVGQTRIHIDTVEGLGDFLELEVVLKASQATSDGEAIAYNLMDKLAVSPSDLIACAYIDLILGQN